MIFLFASRARTRGDSVVQQPSGRLSVPNEAAAAATSASNMSRKLSAASSKSLTASADSHELSLRRRADEDEINQADDDFEILGDEIEGDLMDNVDFDDSGANEDYSEACSPIKRGQRHPLAGQFHSNRIAPIER